MSRSVDKRAVQFLQVLRELHPGFNDGLRILDLGCGNGDMVHIMRSLGYDVYGADIKFKHGDHTQQLNRDHHIRLIDPSSYNLPFPDNFFDVIISDQVFEHVRNYDETLSEMARIMTESAISLHIFPSRYAIIEPHFKAPFGGVLKSKQWYYFWAMFGARRKSQQGKRPAQIAGENLDWIKNYTNYLDPSEILENFKKYFQSVSFAEKAFLKNSRRGRLYYKLCSVIPMLTLPYRYFKSTIIFTKGVITIGQPATRSSTNMSPSDNFEDHDKDPSLPFF